MNIVENNIYIVLLYINLKINTKDQLPFVDNMFKFINNIRGIIKIRIKIFINKSEEISSNNITPTDQISIGKEYGNYNIDTFTIQKL